MIMKFIAKILVISSFLSSCLSTRNSKSIIKNILPNNLVIAHRGTTFYAPEETEAAMRWARNSGADYLEFDLQRTKDGYLIALHDDKLLRTTDVAVKFPERKNDPVSAFTYEELLSLDAGSWFNQAHPERVQKTFVGLDILSLEDIINIAEGNKIKRDASGKRITYKDNVTGKIKTTYIIDEQDNGNRPGIYVETKVPALFPGIETDLKNELERLGWYNTNEKKLKKIITFDGKVSVANTKNRVVLQTFSMESLATLEKVFTRSIPTCFLLWRGSDKDDIPNDSFASFEKWISYGKNHRATIIGPSIAGEPNNYNDLLTENHFKIIQKYNLQIHGYSFDTQVQMNQYSKYVNGMFSNKGDEALKFYQRNTENAAKILNDLGY